MRYPTAENKVLILLESLDPGTYSNVIAFRLTSENFDIYLKDYQAFNKGDLMPTFRGRPVSPGERNEAVPGGLEYWFKEGPSITEEEKILLGDREKAREAKDWVQSDRLRDKLDEHRISFRDTDLGMIWWKER